MTTYVGLNVRDVDVDTFVSFTRDSDKIESSAVGNVDTAIARYSRSSARSDEHKSKFHRCTVSAEMRRVSPDRYSLLLHAMASIIAWLRQRTHHRSSDPTASRIEGKHSATLRALFAQNTMRLKRPQTIASIGQPLTFSQLVKPTARKFVQPFAADPDTNATKLTVSRPA